MTAEENDVHDDFTRDDFGAAVAALDAPTPRPCVVYSERACPPGASCHYGTVAAGVGKMSEDRREFYGCTATGKGGIALRVHAATNPAPTPNDRPPVWPEAIAFARREQGAGPVLDQLVADMEARHRVGVARYGVPLQPGNGRDALLDVYEEELDRVAYAMQGLLENPYDGWWIRKLRRALADVVETREALTARIRSRGGTAG